MLISVGFAVEFHQCRAGGFGDRKGRGDERENGRIKRETDHLGGISFWFTWFADAGDGERAGAAGVIHPAAAGRFRPFLFVEP